MKTLIITVGTRQIGWKCKDGIVRCFGTDGGRNDPEHTDQLYQELDIKRAGYPEGNRTYAWSVRDLGERYYEYCQEWLEGDYSNVQLLIDHVIITDYVKQGLDHVILWGTNQPETVSWSYRRLDTLWLAKLMKQKIKSLFPTLEVDVFDPLVNVNDVEAIRQELQEYILEFAIERLKHKPNANSQFTLLVENKGAAPAISENLAVYAAGLVRQYPVIILNPIPPEPLYDSHENNQLSSRLSPKYQTTSLQTYFFPLEKIRIISAWERGDFEEARIWLAAHQERFEIVYKLAQWLSLAINGELKEFMTKTEQWSNSNLVRKNVEEEQVKKWKEQLQLLKDNDYSQTLENYFIIQNLLERKNYTNAFMLFAQVLERVLSLKLSQYQLEFSKLIDQWNQQYNRNKNDQWFQLLHDIRTERNKVVHEGKSMTLMKISNIWNKNQFTFPYTEDSSKLLKPLHEVIQKVYQGEPQLAYNTFSHSLAYWGLDFLQSN